MSTTTLVALSIFLGEHGRWYVHSERKQAAIALRAACRPGDVVLAPLDISLLALAYSPCRPFVSEEYRPPEREQALDAFYGTAPSEWRSAFLDESRISAVVLPSGRGDPPAAWLAPGTPFRRVASVGEGARSLEVYARIAERAPR
jgi:hypothetical protein